MCTITAGTLMCTIILSHSGTIVHVQYVYYKCKNEVGCRDDTVPKTVETRRHCEED